VAPAARALAGGLHAALTAAVVSNLAADALPLLHGVESAAEEEVTATDALVAQMSLQRESAEVEQQAASVVAARANAAAVIATMPANQQARSVMFPPAWPSAQGAWVTFTSAEQPLCSAP
jgi:hypothetical protein